MSKLALFVLFCVVGAAAYMILTMYYPPFVSFIRGIPTDVTQLTGWVQSNLLAIVPTAAGVGTVVTLLYNQVYKRAKQAQEQLATEKVNLVQGELLSVNTAKAQVEGNLQAVQTRVTEQTALITQLETDKTALTKTVTEQANTIQRLQNDLSYGTKAEKDWVTTEIQKATRKH